MVSWLVVFTSSLVKLGDLRLPLTLALVPIPCFGVEIFRNFDNVRVKMRSRDCKPWIRFVLETCAREYEYAYHISLDFIIPFSNSLGKNFYSPRE